MPRIPANLRRKVVEAADGRCAYCRNLEMLMGVEFEVDHIIPRSAGGKTTAGNLCLSCPSCNRHKANRITGTDPTSNQSASLFHPHQDKWSDHFARSDDGTRILGLTPTGRATVEALRFNRPAMVTLRRYWVATRIQLDKS